jgi:hypothetical protein
MKLFTSVIYKCSEKARVFILSKPFRHSLMFLVRLEPERLVMLANDKIMLERIAKYKHSSLLQIFVNYDSKKIYGIGPRSCCLGERPEG